ncbi:MAG: hypothetical protein ACRC8C_01915, partial [Mycoplasmoidaceae bacterium]
VFRILDSFGNPTYKVQMAFPIQRLNQWAYVYLSSIFGTGSNDNAYYVSLPERGSFSEGSFFTSPAFVNSMPPNISYNDNNPEEILITFNNNATNEGSLAIEEFIFDSTPPNNTWVPNQKTLANISHFNTANNWKQKTIGIKLPYNQNVIIWSIPNGQSHQLFKHGQNFLQVGKTSENGGIIHASFQSTASSLGWLKGLANTKAPSELTEADLTTFGAGNNNFFRISNSLTYENGFDSKIKLQLYGEPIKDDRDGTIQGIFKFDQTFTKESQTYNFTSKIPFRVTGLNERNDTPTTINQNNSISSFLPSDLTDTNIVSLIDIVAAPSGATATNWSVTNPDNSAGAATVSVDISPYYNDTGVLVQGTGKITTNVSGLRQISGTTASRTSTITPDLTVWDINPTNAEMFVEIQDLIPGSPSSAINYEVTNQSPLDGQLTIVASIESGLYYDPTNKGLPSIVGGTPLKLPIIVTGFKTIPNTGTLVIPGTGPYVDILPSSINTSNIMEYITIENAVPGSKSTFSNIISNDKSNNPSEWFVSFEIDFDKAYDINGFIIDPSPKEYVIKGFEVVVPQKNNFITIIAGSVGGGIFLIILIILLIFLLRNRKKISTSNYPRTSEIVLPSQPIQKKLYEPSKGSEIVLPPQPSRVISKEPRITPFSEMPSNPEITRLRSSSTIERPSNSSKKK